VYQTGPETSAELVAESTGGAPAAALPPPRLGRLGAGLEHLRRNRVPGDPTRRYGLAILCIGLFLGFGLSYGNFLTTSNALAILLTCSSIAIAGIAATALLVSGNVDLSISGQLALISVVVAYVARDTESAILACLVGVAMGVGLGLVNGVLVRILRISPLIVTLGTMSIFQGLAFIITGGLDVFGFSHGFTQIGRSYLFGIQMPIVIAAVIFVVGSFALVSTRPGLRVYAIGGNADAARECGVRVERTIVLLYVFMGLAMGVVSVVTTARLGSGTPSVDQNFALDVLTAVILGGVAFNGGSGHPLGVLFGVLTIAVLNAGLIFAGLSDWYQEVFKGTILLLALAMDQFTDWRSRRAVRRKTTADPQSAPVAPDLVAGEVVIGAGDGSRNAFRPEAAPVLRCSGLSKSYGSVRALTDAGLSVRPGEILCLLGDNGAGKSTLIKILSGLIQADDGEIELRGERVRFESVREARRSGLRTVFQDLGLCPNLGVAHNIMLGEEPLRRIFGFIRVRDDRVAANEAIARVRSLGIEIENVHRPVRWFSGGQRQSIAVARVLDEDVSVVILDEPTAALGVNQRRRVLRTIRSLAGQGVAVILITHDIEIVHEIADSVTVLRLGRVIHQGPVGEVDAVQLSALMAGVLVLAGAGMEAQRQPEPL
jgi:ribose/xylose/arabinose/galactoside ABC-type transport system permease subunit/ABC-type multidrug transport system ATPase subunit